MKYSIAAIGLYSEEFITGLFSEIEHLRDKIELTSISDDNEETLLKYQKAWNIKKLYTDPKDLIITESPDILCISQKPDDLIEIITFAAAQKIKGIILNRPISSSLELSQKIIDLCRLNNIKLIINHKKRWDNLYLNVKEIISSKLLGELVSISAEINNNLAKIGDSLKIIDEYGGGDLLYNGSDLIDLIRFFAGEISSINSSLKRNKISYGTETSTYSMFNLYSGLIAFLKTNNISTYNGFKIDLFFENGQITVGKDIKDFFKIDTNADHNLEPELMPADFPSLKNSKESNSGVICEMINSINKQVLPESSGQNNIKNMEIVFGIYYSAYLDGNTVNLPLKIAGNPLKKMFQSNMI